MDDASKVMGLSPNPYGNPALNTTLLVAQAGILLAEALMYFGEVEDKERLFEDWAKAASGTLTGESQTIMKNIVAIFRAQMGQEVLN